MKKIYFFIIASLFFCEIGYSQTITIDIDSSSIYQVENNEYITYCISVQNNSNEFAICWLDKNSSLKQTDFYDYFIKKNGNFSLYNIINESGSTLIVNDEIPFSAIFSTFYKLIKPESSFKIYLFDNHKSSLHNNIKHIARVVMAKEIRKYVHQSDLEALNSLSYKSDYIVIPYKCILQSEIK